MSQTLVLQPRPAQCWNGKRQQNLSLQSTWRAHELNFHSTETTVDSLKGMAKVRDLARRRNTTTLEVVLRLYESNDDSTVMEALSDCAQLRATVSQLTEASLPWTSWWQIPHVDGGWCVVYTKRPINEAKDWIRSMEAKAEVRLALAAIAAELATE